MEKRSKFILPTNLPPEVLAFYNSPEYAAMRDKRFLSVMFQSTVMSCLREGFTTEELFRLTLSAEQILKECD